MTIIWESNKCCRKNQESGLVHWLDLFRSILILSCFHFYPCHLIVLGCPSRPLLSLPVMTRPKSGAPRVSSQHTCVECLLSGWRKNMPPSCCVHNMGWEAEATTNKGGVLWGFDVSRVEEKFWSTETKSKCGKLRIGITGRLGAERKCKEFHNSPEGIYCFFKNEGLGLPGVKYRLDHLPAMWSWAT